MENAIKKNFLFLRFKTIDFEDHSWIKHRYVSHYLIFEPNKNIFGDN